MRKVGRLQLILLLGCINAASKCAVISIAVQLKVFSHENSVFNSLNSLELQELVEKPLHSLIRIFRQSSGM